MQKATLVRQHCIKFLKKLQIQIQREKLHQIH